LPEKDSAASSLRNAQPISAEEYFVDFEKIFFDGSLIFSNWYYKVRRKSTQENPCFMRVSRLVHFFAGCDVKRSGRGNYFAISTVDKKS
jgi:hypothetical protein